MSSESIFSIEGKRALVTGGSMGIGMGIVKRLVDSGAKVMIADIAEEPAMKYINSLPAEKKGNVAFVRADLLDRKTPEKMISEMVKKFGGIDVLVNNAGIYPMVQMLDMEEDLFDRVYTLNLRALAFTGREALKVMMKQEGRGKIINIASIDSLHPSMTGLTAYEASKGGVLMFTRGFALEAAEHGVTVNAIAPGGISTEGTTPESMKNLDPAEQEKMMAQFVMRVPLKRMGSPDDIARVVVFLASAASDYMTGSLVVVDGGRLLM